MTLRETIAAIRAQGGLVYVPHPFDRMHSVPDYEHLLDVVEDVDAIEVFNPRVAFSAFNEEAERFAAKYRIVAVPGSDSHVAAGLGSVKIRMRDFDGPEEFLESLRDADIVRKKQSLLYVQALKFIQTKATPETARRRTARPAPEQARQQEVMHVKRRPGPSKTPHQMPATDDEIREKYLERAIRELNQLTREIQDCDHCPRGNLMPVLGSGHPQADIFMLKFAPRPSEIEEGVAFYGRAGSALMKSFKRLGIDPLAVYGTVFVKCPVADTDLSAPECRARVLDELAIVQPRIVVVMGEEALDGAQRARRAAGRRGGAGPRRDPEAHPQLRRALRAGHRRLARRRERQARLLERVPVARRVVRGFPALLEQSGQRNVRWLASGGKRHVLVVANRTAESDELLAALKERAERGAHPVHAARAPHAPRGGLGGRHALRQRGGRGALSKALERLREARARGQRRARRPRPDRRGPGRGATSPPSSTR